MSDEGDLPIRMLHDRVLVSVDTESSERRSGGGILIPATVRLGRRLTWAKVVSIGPNVRAVKVDDRVLFDFDGAVRIVVIEEVKKRNERTY